MATQAEHPGLGGFGEGRGGERGRPHDPGDRGGPSPRARRWVVVLGAAVVVCCAAVVLLLRLHRVHSEAAQRTALEKVQARGVRIAVTTVRLTPLDRTVTLPGDVYGYYQSTIYAKLSGYVRDVRVQRGQRVRRGQVLATIESPETEKDVLTAVHDSAIADINAERAVRLAPSGVVARQDRDNAVAQQRVAGSTLARARDILAYATVRAPFDGTVIARYVDPGALVPAATGSTTSALPIVDVAEIDTLRVFVYVGQDIAPFVRTGDAVSVWQDELPERRIDAKVSFSTGSLDLRTRTMQVEIDLDNRRYGMLPGTFAHVDLHLEQPPSPEIPDEAILIRGGKTQVCAVVGARAHYVPVDLGYNDGSRVRVLRGLQGGEVVGIDVPVEVQEGDPVQPMSGG